MAEGTEAVLRSFEALMDAEPEVAQGFLIAAVYYRALHLDQSPRDVADTLFKALPADSDWPAFRRALLEMLDK